MHKSTPTAKDAESAYAKATRAELAQDYNSAFQSYIKAAELFLHLSRTNTSDEKKKEKWKNDADKALQRAEKIKQFTDRLGGSRRISSTSAAGPHAESTPSISLTPVAIDPFSPQEQSYILKKGGSVNGLVVPLWEDSHRGDPRSVSCNPRLSATHEEMSACWRQPDDTEYSAILSTDISPQDISQNIIADCSVCSSISVCLEHAQRFGTDVRMFNLNRAPLIDMVYLQLASSILHPVSHEASNVYHLKIFFNGAWRRESGIAINAVGFLAIDSQLPYHPGLGIPLCLTCSPPHQKPVLWPTLLEKGWLTLFKVPILSEKVHGQGSLTALSKVSSIGVTYASQAETSQVTAWLQLALANTSIQMKAGWSSYRLIAMP
ncbi:cysteine protease [Paramarasmius palmivorus]|uniref:Cysteine protease n=1 Tax=Paramarasmius palmivorus TaxID=297713 RepID=A0AAW0AZG0_9AGAR